MRGTRNSRLHVYALSGIIPALAGNTARGACSSHTSWDHPRACGEHNTGATGDELESGSSPRLRGTREQPGRDGRERGIIPALAGNTVRTFVTFSPCRDHPRACGEHMRCPDWRWRHEGSSPRLRGTPRPQTHPISTVGIIPALAGNTLSSGLWGADSWDHPRACGEHSSTSDDPLDEQGSSPRLRGTRVAARRQAAGRGIIPALAGNTAGPDGLARTCWDHPRACGEHVAGDRFRQGLPWIIPALAGNTVPPPLVSSGLMVDHPRACGEHAMTLSALAFAAGSSPRLRGTPASVELFGHIHGIIPALAGNTSR